MSTVKENSGFLKMVMPIITMILLAGIIFEVMLIVQLGQSKNRRPRAFFVENFGRMTESSFEMISTSDVREQFSDPNYYIKRLIREYVVARYSYYNDINRPHRGENLDLDSYIKDEKMRRFSSSAEYEIFKKEFADITTVSSVGGEGLDIVIPEKAEDGSNNISHRLGNQWEIKRVYFIYKTFDRVSDTKPSQEYKIYLSVIAGNDVNTSGLDSRLFISSGFGFRTADVEKRLTRAISKEEAEKIIN